MPITAADLKTVTEKIEAIERRRARQAMLAEQVANYVNGGELGRELAETLRDFLAPKLQARLDAYQASIDTDIAAVRAIVSDYTG